MSGELDERKLTLVLHKECSLMGILMDVSLHIETLGSVELWDICESITSTV